MEILQAIHARRSIRSYTGERISREEMKTILCAGQQAPIAMGNYEDICLTVIRNAEILKRFEEVQAEVIGANPHPFHGAPEMVVVSVNPMEAQVKNMEYANAGFILQNMSLVATALGVGSCIIYGAFDRAGTSINLNTLLSIPEDYVCLGGIVLGKTTEKYHENLNKHEIRTTFLD